MTVKIHAWKVLRTQCAFAFAFGFACLGLLPATAAETAEVTGTVRSDRVNVRGAASFIGEVITQLKQGEAVVILEEIEVAKPSPGEPAKWLKVRMPANTPVWVNAGFIDSATKAVKPNRLNLRAGPGENFSIVGRVEQGTILKEIRVDNEWMEIEAPETAYGFVSAQFIDLPVKTPAPEAVSLAATPLPSASPVAAAQTPPPAATQVLEAETPIAAPPAGARNPNPPPLPGQSPATPPATPPAPLASAAAVPAPAAPAETAPSDEPLPKRMVTREGIVIRTASIQAPTAFGIENIENGRTMNYLSTAVLGVKLDNLRGRKVRVYGEEKMDRRWKSVPILEVESLRLIE